MGRFNCLNSASNVCIYPRRLDECLELSLSSHSDEPYPSVADCLR
jgi:hypothetical protein